MSDGMGREPAYLSSHATNRYFIPNWGKGINCRIKESSPGFIGWTVLKAEYTAEKGKAFIQRWAQDKGWKYTHFKMFYFLKLPTCELFKFYYKIFQIFIIFQTSFFLKISFASSKNNCGRYYCVIYSNIVLQRWIIELI